MSMRRGATPIWKTTSGAVRSDSDSSFKGAPNAASAR